MWAPATTPLAAPLTVRTSEQGRSCVLLAPIANLVSRCAREALPTALAGLTAAVAWV